MGQVTGWSHTWDRILIIEDGFRYSSKEPDQSAECDRTYVVEDVQLFMQDCVRFNGSPKEFMANARQFLDDLEERKRAGRPLKADTTMWDAWVLAKSKNPMLRRNQFIVDYDDINEKTRLRRNQLLRRGRSQLDRERRRKGT